MKGNKLVTTSVADMPLDDCDDMTKDDIAEIQIFFTSGRPSNSLKEIDKFFQKCTKTTKNHIAFSNKYVLLYRYSFMIKHF